MASSVFVSTSSEVPDVGPRLDIDGLFEGKRKRDLARSKDHVMMLQRVHRLIRDTAKDTDALPCCWFHLPEVILSRPSYNAADCIVYLVNELRANKFAVDFYRPRSLFITWKQYVPSYARGAFERATGVRIDEFGRPLPPETDDAHGGSGDATHDMFRSSGSGRDDGAAAEDGSGKKPRNRRQFTPIDAYRPSGRMLYGEATMENIDRRARPR